jgi:hypothetical protein
MAERKAGEILARMEKVKNQHSAPSTTKGAAPLRDIGITHTQSHWWQQSAKVPEDVFETYVQAANDLGKEITSAGLYKLANKVAPKGKAGRGYSSHSKCVCG